MNAIGADFGEQMAHLPPEVSQRISEIVDREVDKALAEGREKMLRIGSEALAEEILNLVYRALLFNPQTPQRELESWVADLIEDAMKIVTKNVTTGESP